MNPGPPTLLLPPRPTTQGPLHVSLPNSCLRILSLTVLYGTTGGASVARTTPTRPTGLGVGPDRCGAGPGRPVAVVIEHGRTGRVTETRGDRRDLRPRGAATGIGGPLPSVSLQEGGKEKRRRIRGVYLPLNPTGQEVPGRSTLSGLSRPLWSSGKVEDSRVVPGPHTEPRNVQTYIHGVSVPGDSDVRGSTFCLFLGGGRKEDRRKIDDPSKRYVTETARPVN